MCSIRTNVFLSLYFNDVDDDDADAVAIAAADDVVFNAFNLILGFVSHLNCIYMNTRLFHNERFDIFKKTINQAIKF